MRIISFPAAYNGVMLKNVIPQFYKVKRGQTLRAVAEAFSLPECAIVVFNSLKTELWEGQILRIPKLRGNLYTVRAGDTKTLLSGSEENFEQKNMTSLLYPGMKVLLQA